jgi:hypothetical protein
MLRVEVSQSSPQLLRCSSTNCFRLSWPSVLIQDEFAIATRQHPTRSHLRQSPPASCTNAQLAKVGRFGGKNAECEEQ